MKKYSALLFFLASCFPVTVQADHTLQLEMRGLQSDKGHVMLALYQYSADASWQDTPVETVSIDASNGTDGNLYYTLHHVHDGSYAIRLFHDENDNQRIDTASNGIPLESFAFSGLQAVTGIPTLEEASFTVQADTETLILTLKHPQITASGTVTP